MGGRASATVRVDSVGEGICIGVLTDRFTDWEDIMWQSPWAWFYGSGGQFWHHETRQHGLAELVAGNVVRVTLDSRRVTFNVDGRDQHTATLPEQFGNISLGV